jgi:hypothetical protein
LLGLLEGAGAEGVEPLSADPFGELVEAVEPEENVAEVEVEVSGAEGLVELPLPVGIELVEGDGQGLGGAVVVDDGEGHEHGARPVAHVPKIDVEPLPDEEDLGGDGGHVVPSHEADEGQVELGEGVHARDATEVAGDLPGAKHAWVRAGNAGELEGEVGLDGGVHLRRAVGVDVPAPVGKLLGKDVMDRLALPRGVHLPPPVVEGDHVGHERDVDEELAHPVALGLLLGEQEALGTGDGLVEAGPWQRGRGGAALQRGPGSADVGSGRHGWVRGCVVG